MFSPIKNLITYIQKNASSNSMFCGNSTMETEHKKIEQTNADAKTEGEFPKEIDKPKEVEVEEDVTKVDNSKDNDAKLEIKNEPHIESSEDIKNSESATTTSDTTPVATTEDSFIYEDEDIEEQIGSSIMLKTPVKVAITKSSEILELKKASKTHCSIFISHDLNRNQTKTPTDDELEDFRHDPTEVLRPISSPCSNQPADDFCSVGSAEEALNRDFKSLDDLTTEDERDGIKTDDEQKPMMDSDLDVVDDKDIETEIEQQNTNDGEDEEPFLELARYKSRNVIVLDDGDLNASVSLDTNNTADDPLAIAGEEQEAFAADKTAALEELNLLNNSRTSQDDDTRTTTDDDLRWCKTDLENNQPSCSSNSQMKDNKLKETPEKEERNGDGSDSGLGSETSALHITTSSIADTSQSNMNTVTPVQTPTQIKTNDSEKVLSSNVLRLSKSPSKELPKPHRSNLKRRLDVDGDAPQGLETSSSLNEHGSLNGSVQKKPKRSINFDTVQVYYFPRQQGFSCVPSAGGCTLGMGARHIAFKTLTLAEHAAELRRQHRMQLQEVHPRGSSSEDSEESEEDYLSEGSGSDLDGESNGFLQPVSPKQRRALLKTAGIRKIDPSEKADCRNIRNSREVCGCTCRDFCDPETCACSQSGIKCQVDRDMFPCGCSRDACGNTIGRVEFNPTRVRTHYIHTLMRLEMENRQQQNPYSSAIASALQPTPSSYYQSHLQPQSNYSSGYASPAYNTASEIHQQTAASSYYHTQTPSTSNSLYGQQTSLEMIHTGNANPSSITSHYGIDSLDSSMFVGPPPSSSSYGELMSVGSFHYGNLQTQGTPYNTYHNGPYLNTNSSTTSHNTSNTFSSCAVPSIPPFGAATTTEAAGIYHSVNALHSLETTTAPSCNANGTTSLENEVSSSFISLSTPLASSSRLSQINDLLQHNRNTTTALVAVLQSTDSTDNISEKSMCLTETTGNLETANSSLCSSMNIPQIENAPKNSSTGELLQSPLNSTPNNEDYNINDSVKPLELPDKIKTSIENIDESPSLLNSDFLPQTSMSEDNKEPIIMAVSASIEPSTIEVAVGN